MTATSFLLLLTYKGSHREQSGGRPMQNSLNSCLRILSCGYACPRCWRNPSAYRTPTIVPRIVDKRFHGFYIFINPVMCPQPAELALVTQQHLFLLPHRAADVNDRRWMDDTTQHIFPFHRVQIIQMRDTQKRLNAVGINIASCLLKNMPYAQQRWSFHDRSYSLQGLMVKTIAGLICLTSVITFNNGRAIVRNKDVVAFHTLIVPIQQCGRRCCFPFTNDTNVCPGSCCRSAIPRCHRGTFHVPTPCM